MHAQWYISHMKKLKLSQKFPSKTIIIDYTKTRLLLKKFTPSLTHLWKNQIKQNPDLWRVEILSRIDIFFF